MDNNKTPDPFNKTDNFTTLKGFENPIIVKEKSKPKEPSNALVAADKKEEKIRRKPIPKKIADTQLIKGIILQERRILNLKQVRKNQNHMNLKQVRKNQNHMNLKQVWKNQN